MKNQNGPSELKSKILEKLRLIDTEVEKLYGHNSMSSIAEGMWKSEGAKEENSRILTLLDPILENYEECVRALSEGDQYSKSAALFKHKEIMEKK